MTPIKIMLTDRTYRLIDDQAKRFNVTPEHYLQKYLAAVFTAVYELQKDGKKVTVKIPHIKTL